MPPKTAANEDERHFKYEIPRLTFGVELELCFIVRRALYFAWLGEPDPRLARRRPEPEPTPSEADNQAEAQLQLEDSRSSPDRRNMGGWDWGPESPAHDGPYRLNSDGSIRSDDVTLQKSLRRYMAEFFNHTLPGSQNTPSLFGMVQATEAEKGDPDTWYLEEDHSIDAHRDHYAELHDKELADIKRDFHVGGAELVSRILNLEQEEEWRKMLEQIYNELEFDQNHGVWLNGSEGLHVHFAMLDEEIGLHTLQNLLALYGLFEREIEMWVEPRRRYLSINPFAARIWCRSIRYGMEVNSRKDPNHEASYDKIGHQYTPQEFTERMYTTKSDLDLVSEVYGFAPGELEEHPEYRDFAKDVTVYISPQRENKAQTIEFRHHQATTDPEVIRWWVKFCGSMLNYSRTLALLDVKLLDEPDADMSFVGELTKRSILDIIGFSEEGKEHFQKRKREENDDGSNAWRAIEERLIQERAKRRRIGQIPNIKMDVLIKRERWFIDAKAQLEANHGLKMDPKNDEKAVEAELELAEAAEAQRISRVRGRSRQTIAERMHEGKNS